MPENLPDVVRPAPPALADTDSWVDIARPIIALAERIAETDFVPRGLRGSAPATAAAMLYGREVGLPPMTALNVTHVIEGKPAISAEAMRALVMAAGHEIETIATTGALCTMRGRRRGAERWSPEITWTIDAARAAGVAGKQVWKSYPRQMLQARATAELCRLVFPDVIHGFRAVEEFDDDAEAPAATAPTAGRTRVSRTKKTTAAPAATPPPLEPARRPEIAGPPLPGEEGFDESLRPEGGASAPSDDGGPPSQGEPAGEDQEGGADAVDTVDVSADTAESAGNDEAGAGESEGEAGEPVPDSTSDRRGPRPATRAQHRMIFALLKDKEIGDGDRHDYVSAIVGRRVESFDDLTHDNASAIIDTLGRLDRGQLDELLTAFVAQESDS